jgi:hypothetical protein
LHAASSDRPAMRVGGIAVVQPDALTAIGVRSEAGLLGRFIVERAGVRTCGGPPRSSWRCRVS